MEVEMEHTDVTNDIGGMISPVVSLGQKPYIYEWSGPSVNNTNINDQHLFDIDPGEYCVTITDFNDCELIECVNINDVCHIPGNVIITPTCEGMSFGEIAFEHIQPNSIYTYELIGDGYHEYSNFPLFSNLSADDYLLIINDENAGCSKTLTGLQLTNDYYSVIEDFDEICIDEDATINLTITTYSQFDVNWSNGSVGSSITVDEVGSYSYTITNNENSCEYSNSLYITSLDPSITTPFYSPEYFSCIDNEVFATYKYLTNNNPNWQYVTVPVNEEYCLINGTETCYDEKCFKNEYEELNLGNEDCIFENNELIAHVNGGLEPYSYLWSDGQITPSIIVDKDQEYILTVTDAIGCFIEKNYSNFVLATPLEIGIPLSGIGFDDDTNAISLTVQANGGIQPYSYLWNNGDETATTIFSTPNNFGTFSVTVTDECGQRQTESINISKEYDNNVTDLFDFPSNCSGYNIDVTIKEYNPPWWFLWNYEKEIINIHWPNAGINSEITVVEMAYKLGKKTRYRVLSGPNSYTIQFNDLWKKLPFIVTEDGNFVIKNDFFYTPTAEIAYFGYSGLLPQQWEGYKEVILGYTQDCSSCYTVPNAYNTPNSCQGTPNYISWIFEPNIDTDPCGSGILYITDRNGNQETIEIFQNGNYYEFFNQSPSQFNSYINCSINPGCLWDAEMLPPQFIDDNLLLGKQIYAPICNPNENQFCNGEGIGEIVGFTEECIANYHCNSDPDYILYEAEMPIKTYKVKPMAPHTIKENEYYVISTCRECIPNPMVRDEFIFFEPSGVPQRFSYPADQVFLDGLEEADCLIDMTLYTFKDTSSIESRVKVDLYNVNNNTIIHPNPFIQEFQIEADFNINSIAITNIDGRLIFSENYYNLQKNIKLDLTDFNLSNGIYIVRINNFTNKLIIKNE